jgi:hypothetical protein
MWAYKRPPSSTHACAFLNASAPSCSCFYCCRRLLQVNEAKKVCPELVTVHVETIGIDGTGSGGDNVAGGEDADGGGDEEGGAGAVGDSRQQQQQQQQELKTNRLTQKACLERYRCGGTGPGRPIHGRQQPFDSRISDQAIRCFLRQAPLPLPIAAATPLLLLSLLPQAVDCRGAGAAAPPRAWRCD